MSDLRYVGATVHIVPTVWSCLGIERATPNKGTASWHKNVTQETPKGLNMKLGLFKYRVVKSCIDMYVNAAAPISGTSGSEAHATSTATDDDALSETRLPLQRLQSIGFQPRRRIDSVFNSNTVAAKTTPRWREC